MSGDVVNSDGQTLPPGTKVGAYRIERLLGRGGMADVYYAVHETLLRPAALKILRAALASDSQHLQRFQQEARAAASLTHPNIVQVYDVNLDGPYRYIAQEFVPGTNLRDYLSQRRYSRPASDATHAAEDNRGDTDGVTAQDETGRGEPLSIRETLSILLQVLAALSKSHRAGIVHRDIKPENIMLTEDGEVKVADFGLARMLYGDDPQLTQAGTTMGTPLYMSPEQIQDGKVDIRSDLYSLGVTLFHMLTGQPPFVGDTPLALAMKHVQAPPPDIRSLRPDVPGSLANLIMRLLAKSPDERPADPAEVLRYLQEHRDGDLAPHWPEQNVPLPGVVPVHPVGVGVQSPSLQANNRVALVRRVLRGVLALALITGLFALGFSATYRANVLPPSETQVFRGIPRQPTVRDQYVLALLSNDLHALDKWEAVGVYFPKDANPTNRSFVAQATIQLARALQKRREYDSALRRLDELTADPNVPALYRALAELQKAAIYEELDNEEKYQSAIEAARRIVNHPDFPTGDRQHVNEVVGYLSERIARLWLGN